MEKRNKSFSSTATSTITRIEEHHHQKQQEDDTSAITLDTENEVTYTSKGKQSYQRVTFCSRLRRSILDLSEPNNDSDDKNNNTTRQPAWRKTAFLVLIIAIGMIVAACALGVYAMRLQHKQLSIGS